MVTEKIRCISTVHDLVRNKIYTGFDRHEEHGEEFVRVLEINNGDNCFYSWRFTKLPLKINPKVTVL